MSKRTPRTALRDSIVPRVQCFGHQHQRCCSLSAASRRPALSLRAVARQFDVSRNTDSTRLAMMMKKPVNPVTEFSLRGPQKWLLPRHSRRQEARRCTRRSAPALPKAGRRNIAHSRSFGLYGIRERRPSSARAEAVCGWKPFLARSDSLHCCAARWTTLRIIFMTRPSLGPMSASSLHSPRERNDERRRRPNDADAQTDDPRRPSPSSSRRARA